MATWSLSTLRRASRSAPDGLPRVSTYTRRRVFHEAGYNTRLTRTWYPIGSALRRRKAGPAVIAVPALRRRKAGPAVIAVPVAEPKKVDRCPCPTISWATCVSSLRADRERAEIHYRDAAGLVFDFHALRGQLATNADAAGAAPRVVRRLMRHGTLELTGPYTGACAVDLKRAAATLPSLGYAETDWTASLDRAAAGVEGATHRVAIALQEPRRSDSDNQ